MELTVRQRKILALVVKEYIDTATPVGSAVICQKHLEAVSPATVRNELAALEELGFLTHPYTSAGRIPTDRGYRFYVDELMDAYRLTARERTLVEQLQIALGRDMDALLQETLRVIQLLSESCAAVIKTDSNLLVSGLAKMFYEPEFENVQNIRRMMSVFDDRDEVLHLLDEHSGGETSISIGTELGAEPFKNCSLVAQDFFYKGARFGSLGVIGPTRMRYGKVTAAVDTIAHALDGIFAEL
ncbi:transcriptional regulator of heat shock response HrcA [Candidatus Termititenax aidoneus]|uniref:Heat-inducible transcription repressor HrcA n=1 Tax=Termititenax aidoneus TaxID=2218524 RepID=A0A388TD24_TERA1|nr:transcriptional regulator of heat shock response HrcA [Candidatus Termititenax aidoneus]